jgi:release factor glutamine methyltransferase
LENQIIILKSDLLQNLPEKADLIIANLPYLNQEKISSLPLEILSEPIIALDGGGDGLLIIKKFLVQTPIFLKKGGQIYLEIDHGQGYKLKKLAKKIYPQATISINQDLQKLERVLIIRT